MLGPMYTILYVAFISSVLVDERSDLVYDKINRRLEHLTGLKSNSSKRESEQMLVRVSIDDLLSIYYMKE